MLLGQTKLSAKLLILILVAIIIRLIIMPISTHPDLFFINMFPNLFYSQQVLEIFSYLEENFPQTRLSYYTPLTYYTFVLFQYPYHLISNSFATWMTDLYEFYINLSQIAYTKDYLEHVKNAFLFRDLFLAKIPYLVFETASIILLFKFVRSKSLKPTAIIAWLFAPILIYSIYIHGQFDIIPAFFVLLGFFLLKKNPYVSLIAFGVAAAFKNYSLLFILIVSFVWGKTIGQKIKMILVGCAPYAISLIPILINDPKLSIYSLFPKPYFVTSLSLSGWPLISRYLHLVALLLSELFIFLVAYVVKTKDKWQTALSLSLVAITLVLTLAPLVVFQYLVWVYPLTLLFLRKAKTVYLFTTTQALFAASFMLLANHVQLGLFAPLNNQYFSSFPTFNQIINDTIPYTIISTIGYLAFVLVNLSLCAVVLINVLFKSKGINSPESEESFYLPKTSSLLQSKN